MVNSNLEVVHLYEDLNLDVESIAEETGFEPASVKAILAQFSRKFKTISKTRANVEGQKEIISEEEDADLIAAAKSLALSSDNDIVRARMIIYLHDEKMGRNDKENTRGLNLNIIMLNKAVREAKERRKEEEKDEDKIIDV